MPPKDNKDYVELRRKWYGKLKKEGFDDIEQLDGNLKTWVSSEFTRNYDANFAKAKEDYYRLAGQFLHRYHFKDKKEQLIWELHSQGVSIRDIVKELKKKNYKIYKSLVQVILERLTGEMIIKSV